MIETRRLRVEVQGVDSPFPQGLPVEIALESPVPPPRPAAHRSLGGKMMRSVVFGALRYVLIAPLPFLMTPLILHRIGVAGYGTWAVFLAINGLTSLADLGLVGTLSKFVAEYYAREDFSALARLLNSGLALFLALDLTIGVTVWLLSPWLATRLFRGTSIAHAELLSLMRCFLVVIAANILLQLLSSITAGLQRLDLTSMLSAMNILLSALFGAALLLRGWGLRGLVYGYSGSAVVTILAYVVVVRNLLPQLRIGPRQFDRREARIMLSYSLRLYVTSAAVVLHNQIEKVLLASLVGVAPVGWYEIASDLALKVRGSIGFILGPGLPAASELHALGDESRLRDLYYRTHKYLAVFGVPVVCYVAAVSSRFVALWIGPGMKMIALPLSVLLIANFINLATGPGFQIFAGSGVLRPGIQSATLGVVLNVILSFVLIYKFGFAGAVVGTSFSVIVSSIFFILLFHRRTGYSIARVLRESYWKPAGCSLLAIGLVLTIHPANQSSWFGLVAIGAAFALLYGLAILFSRFFDEYDWIKFETLLPDTRLLRRILPNA